MKVVKQPIFLLDVANCADYLFTEGGEDVARRWKQSLDLTADSADSTDGTFCCGDTDSQRLTRRVNASLHISSWLSCYPR